MQPVSSGYVDVNGIKLYHEIYGAGEPLVLLHGGLMTTKEMSPLIQAFAGGEAAARVQGFAMKRVRRREALHKKSKSHPRSGWLLQM